MDLNQAQVNDITDDDTTNIGVTKSILLTTELSDTSQIIGSLTDANCSMVYFTDGGFGNGGTFEVYDSFGGNLLDSVTITESIAIDKTLNLINLQTKGLSASEVSTMAVYARNTIAGAAKLFYADKISCIIDYVPSAPPSITSESITTGLTSGETATVRANITDISPISMVWFTINNTNGILTNYTMVQEGSSNFYNGTFKAGNIGTNYYKVYANNTYGILNNTASWHTFSVSKPSGTPQNEDYPNKALPSSTIKITADLVATDLLEEVYAYLNIPRKFLFIETSTYPQNQSKGNFSPGETKTATWLLYNPGTESSYSFNITWTDKYGNDWQGSNKNILVQWAVSQLSVSSDIGSFYSQNENVDIYSIVTGSDGGLVSAAVNVNTTYPNGTQLSAGASTEVSIGRFKYNFNLPSGAPTGTYQVKIDATYGSNEAHEVRTFLISPVLENINDIVNYINQTITNTIIPYLEEINSTTHTTYSYLTDTIKPQLNGIGENVSYIKDNMATSSALSNLQNDVTWLISNVATQENITILEGKIDIIDSNVDILITTTDCSNPVNSVLCSYLDNTNSTVTDLKTNWGSYNAEDIMFELYEINTTTQNTYSYLQNEITTKLIELNTTTQNIYIDTQNLLTKWGTYTAEQIYNISNATYYKTIDIYNDMATASSLSSIQTDVTWLINNVATQENMTLINSKIDTIDSTVNTIKNQTDCSVPANSELCTFLDNTNTTVSDIKDNWGSYNASEIITRLIEINTTTQDNYDYLQNTVYTRLDETYNNTQQTLTYIGNPNDDENQNTLFGEHVYTQNRLTEINGNLTEVRTIVTQINITTEAINSTVSTILLEVDDLEELHQCSIVPNSTICNLLNLIRIDTQNIYALTVEINQTTHTTYSYLTDTIYPKLDIIENNTNNLLSNSTEVWNKLLMIEGSITDISVDTENLINITNCSGTSWYSDTSSLCYILNDIKTRLIEINTTTQTTLNNIVSVIMPQLITINTTVNTITEYTDTLEDELNCVNPTDSDICFRLNLIQNYTITLETNLATLTNNLESHNSTVYSQLDNIITIINTINTNTDSIEGGQDNILNSLSQLQDNITMILNDLGIPPGFTLWGKLITLESLATQINSTVNTINDNTDEAETLVQDIINLVACTNSSSGTVCNKMNSLSTSINDLQIIMEQNQSTIYTKLVETFDNVTNTYNKVNDVIGYLDCTIQTTDSVCWRLTNIQNNILEINTTTNNILNNLTLIVIPKLNTIDTNINEIKDNINTLEASFNCTLITPENICYRLNLIQNYTNNIGEDIFNLSTQLTNHDTNIITRFNSINNNLSLIYDDTQYIRIQNFSGGSGEGLTTDQNATLYNIITVVNNNKNLLLSINETVNDIKTIQQTSLVTGALKVEHTTVNEYRRGEEGSSVVLVTLNGVPISGVTITGDYYYPNQSLWLDDAVFTEIEDTGMYYYNFTVPITDPEGVYKVKITAEQSTSGSSAGDNFEDGNADGWSTTGATYVVVDEGQPQNYVYQKTDYGGFMFAWSTAMGSQTDYTLTAKARSDGYQGYFGLTFRYLDSGNNYIVYARQGANNLRLMKHTNGGVATLTETAYNSLVTNDGQWYNFTVIVEGAHFLIYVDDVLYIDYTDIGSPHETGYVGAFTYNSIASWDDFNVIASGTADYAYSMIDFKIDDTIIEAIQNVSSEFSITNLVTSSPKYPNEAVKVEATFANKDGSVTPDTIDMTIYKPDYSTVWYSADKDDFSVQNGIWYWPEMVESTPTTGTYYVSMNATYNGYEDSRTTQFRIATGGPYSVALNCPSTSNVGSSLDCTLVIVDEGEAETESICDVWVDTNGNLIRDITEPQKQKSQITWPQQNRSIPISIDISNSHPTGDYITRASCSYVNSGQPDSTASDFVTLNTATPDGGSGGGGGGGGGTGGTVTPTPKPIIPEEEGEKITGRTIKKSEHLMDVLTKILDEYKHINPGGKVIMELTLYNFGTEEIKDAKVKYCVENDKRVKVKCYEQTIAIYTKIQLVKEFLISSNTKPGEYFIKTEISYNSETATSETSFEVVEETSKMISSSNLIYILIILIVLGILIYLGIKKKKEIKELFRKKRKAKEKVTAYNILNVKNIIIAVLAVIVLASVLFNISIKEIPSKIINVLSAVKLPPISLNWWFVFGALLILFLAGIFVVLIFILKEIRKLTAGKRSREYSEKGKAEHKTNKKMLLIIGVIALIILFLLMLISNPSITGNVVGATNTGNGVWFLGFILIIGIVGLLIFSSKNKNKEIFQESRNIEEKSIIEKKTEIKSSHQDLQNLHSVGFKVKPSARERLEKMQGLDKPSPGEIRTNVYKMLEENGIDVGNSSVLQKTSLQKPEQTKPEIQTKRISAPINKQVILNQLKEVYK